MKLRAKGPKVELRRIKEEFWSKALRNGTSNKQYKEIELEGFQPRKKSVFGTKKKLAYLYGHNKRLKGRLRPL